MTEPDPRIDAVRGCVALERGPLVYCLESADLPGGVTLEEIELGPVGDPTAVPRPDIGASVVGLRLAGRQRPLSADAWPYREAGVDPAGVGARLPKPQAIDVDAIPYFSWANRSSGAMRVWIPRGSSGEAGLSS